MFRYGKRYLAQRSIVSCHSRSPSPGKAQMMSVERPMRGTLRVKVSTQRANSSTVYSRFMTSRMAFDPVCTGRCRYSKTLGCLSTSHMPSRCRSRYGGLLMPRRSMTRVPSSSFTTARSSVTMSVPMSMPYAPVSSDVIRISTIPSATTARTRATMSATGHDCRSPRACLVLQYVQKFRHPALIGTISISRFRRTFGSASAGIDRSPLRDADGLAAAASASSAAPNSRTVLPCSASPTTYPMRSISRTPTTLTSAHCLFFGSPCGTHPATTTGFPVARARLSIDTKWSSDGFLTVQLLMT
mmetsp:Transcript_36765/g.113398  ORF Transcript_36765/g.113398 Transcript_36765/m.113398 type:complete len:300 (-) Transcript_36765:293-1192(-)